MILLVPATIDSGVKKLYRLFAKFFDLKYLEH